MRNKSCLRGCHITLLVIILFPSCAYMLLLLYGKYHSSNNRTFVADTKSIGYEISFSEIEHDSILSFCFNQKGDSKKKTTLFVYNNAWEVISFIFTKDTILVRDELKLCELFPNEEIGKQTTHAKELKKSKLTKGNMPSNCKVIPFSDSHYFYYDRSKGKYFLKDSTTHIIKLIHDIERTNTYHLLDVTAKDTSEIELLLK